MAKIEVLSPVTGSVCKVECAVGQDVSEGDVLFVMESMKMQIPVEATVSGKVESVSAGEGDTLEEDAAICVIAT